MHQQHGSFFCPSTYAGKLTDDEFIYFISKWLAAHSFKGPSVLGLFSLSTSPLEHSALVVQGSRQARKWFYSYADTDDEFFYFVIHVSSKVPFCFIFLFI